MQKVFAVVAVGLLASLSACASTSINMAVSSYAAPAAAQFTKFVILPDKGIDAESLEFREYSSHIEKIMSIKGWEKVYSVDDASSIVFVSYGIGDPKQHNFSYSVPTFGQTGVASSSTSGSINSYGNTATYNATTTYTPSYGVTGYVPVSGQYTTYDRWLKLNAIDLTEFRASKKLQEIWRLSVSSTGSSGDLRKIFPYMAYAAMPYLAENSGKAVSVVIPEDGKQIKAFLLPQQAFAPVK
ncbi:MAG: hypothetical protein ACOYLS_14815 [Polymorphobacter sp.]